MGRRRYRYDLHESHYSYSRHRCQNGIINARLCSTLSLLDSRAEQLSMQQLVRRVAVLDQTAFGMLYDAMFSHVRGQAPAALSSGGAVDARQPGVTGRPRPGGPVLSPDLLADDAIP